MATDAGTTSLTAPSPGAPLSGGADTTLREEVLVDEELLVEEISIDGMCGVY